MADLQQVVDGIAAMTCVVSVEDLGNGDYGTIRIVTGNKSYIDSIENPADGAALLTDKFIPNSEYTRYLTQDLNFEDFCYRSAVQKKCLHSYAHPDRMDVWFNMTFLPLDADEGNLRYCTYTMEMNFEPSSERLSNVSGKLASRVLETAINLRGASDFRQSISDVVKDTRELCEAEYCCILLVDEYNQSCSVLGDSLADGSTLVPMEELIDDDFYEIAESWESTIAGSNCLIAKNEHDMQIVKDRNPRWYESLVNASVNSVALFPLKTHDQSLGYMWAVNFDADNAGHIKEALELTTFILSSEINNHLLVDRLRVLSSKDMLTGVMNRNEMNNYVDRLSNGTEASGASTGVLFADLNGLKAINDTEGHAAGDRLLKDATKALLEAFKPEEIFRAGGDEFCIITIGLTEDELAEKADMVRNAATKYDAVSFAIGTYMEPNAKDVRRALRIADERMYEDKELYYARKGRR